MANQNIKLQKTVISNNNSNTLYNKGFDKLAKSDIEINESRILDIYDIVFYDTPKIGTYSHTSIVQRIHDYVFSHVNRQLDNKIELLSDQLVVFNEELDFRQSPQLRQHPVYENGSFIIAGENGIKYEGSDTVYIMQEGYLRAFKNTEIYSSVRKCLDLPHTGSLMFSNLYYVPLTELQLIDQGKDIVTSADLNIVGKALDKEDVEISAYYSNYNLRLYCKGVEIQDTADLLILEPDALFYYSNESCEVEYFNVGTPNNEPKTVQEGRGRTTIYIPPGQYRDIRIGRDNDLQLDIDGVPSYAGQYYEDVPVLFNGNDIPDYQKQWGENEKYNGITSVKGRVGFIERGKDVTLYSGEENFENEHPASAAARTIGKTLNIGYNPETLGYNENILGVQPTDYSDITPQFIDTPPSVPYGVLNGLPSRIPVTNRGALGEEMSNYGTRMIYPGSSGLHGDQFLERDLQNVVFNDPSSVYYHPEFYGQPIFRYDNDYLVMIGFYKTSVGGYMATLSLDKKRDRTPVGYAIASIGWAYLAQALDGAHIRYYGINTKLKEKDDNDFDKLPLGNRDNGHIEWRPGSSITSGVTDYSGRWNKKRLRYKGFKGVPTIGFNCDARNFGCKNGNENALEKGFVYPQYLHFDHPNQWTPWE